MARKRFAKKSYRRSSRRKGYSRSAPSRRRRGYGSAGRSRVGGIKAEVKYATTAAVDPSIATGAGSWAAYNDGLPQVNPVVWRSGGVHIWGTGDAASHVSLAASYSHLLTPVVQGFEGQRRIGLSVSPRQLIVRLTLQASTQYVSTAGDAMEGGFDVQFPADVARMAGGGIAALADQQTKRQIYLRTATRVVIFRDMEPGLVTGSSGPEFTQWSDIFTSGSSVPGVPSTTDFLEIGQVGRYQIVYDNTVNLDADDPQRSLSVSVPLKSKTLRYGSNLPNQVRAGHYFMIMCRESHFPPSDVVPSIPDLTHMTKNFYQARMSFTDA